MLTLDEAITTWGHPAFIKIDVEGYEFEVISGLSVPIQCCSLEVTAEYIENTLKCIDRLSALARYEFQFSRGESMVFSLPDWVSSDDMKVWLGTVKPPVWGDLYARKIG